MLRLEVALTAPRKRRLGGVRPGYIEVYLEGETESLTDLKGKLAEAASTGTARLDAESPAGVVPILVFLGVGGLQALPLERGLLVYGDRAALDDVVRGVDYCLNNAASAAPLDGYHHHVELHNEASREPIGEITVTWTALPSGSWSSESA